MKDLLSLQSRRYVLRLLIAGALYGVVGYGSFYLMHANWADASLVWPASAVGLAFLWLWGVELWPGLLLGLFIVLLVRGHTPVLSSAVALGNMLEAIAACYLLRLASFSPRFARLRDTLAYVSVAIITTFFSSLWLALASYFFYTTPAIFNSTLWSSLWVGHTVSLITLGPFLLYWGNRPLFRRSGHEILEGIAVFGAIGVFAFLPSWTPYESVGSISLIYFLVVALIWASLRTGPRGTSLALAMSVVIISGGVLFGNAAVSNSSNLTQTLFGVQVLIGILSIIFLPFTSITEERKDAMDVLQRHVEQLEEALSKIQGEDQAKTDFIAILAHELRNPLSPILSSLELMKQAGIKNENEAYVNSIATHVHMMARLLDDLLDISRISQKKFKLEVEPVDFNSVISQTLEMVRPFMEARKHNLSVILPQEPVWLTADPVRLAQVFVNLLNNAAKYTDPNGSITLLAAKEGDRLKIVVKDSGVGIPPDRIPYVFEAFGGSEGVERRPGGLRIGLSLARRMVEMHHGTIAVHSAGPGEGAEFTVVLPLPATAPLPLETPRRTRGRFSRGTLKRPTGSGHSEILVVDDNEPAANALAALLRGNGHEVTVASTGKQALESAHLKRPHAALLDIGLPDMDGYELAKTMRERFGTDLILIALTGYGQSEDKMRAREAGFNEHLTKPVSIVDIERTISELSAR